MKLDTFAALALIEDHHVERGVPSVSHMCEVQTTMEVHGDAEIDPATLAHDTLRALGWRTDRLRVAWLEEGREMITDVLIYAQAMI